MRQRGRKSAAALAVVPIDARQQRPEPPKRLSRAEKAVWRETTAAVRPDWFWSSEFLLEIFCRSVVLERWLAEQITVTAPTDEHFADLVKMQRAEAMLVGNLAGKLRLTPRSTWDRYTPKLASTLPKPWDVCAGPERTGRGFQNELAELLERRGKKPEEPEGSPPAV